MRPRLPIVFLLGLFSVPAVHAAPIEGSWVWGWFLAAFTDDFTGRFDHCGIRQQWPNGSSLAFSMNERGWSMGIEDRRWRLRDGERFAMRYSVDNGPETGGWGEAVSRSVIKIDLAPSPMLFEQMKIGQQVEIAWGILAMQFPLTMSASALPALHACVQRYAPGANPFAGGR